MNFRCMMILSVFRRFGVWALLLFALLSFVNTSQAQTNLDITAVIVQPDSQHINAVATHTLQFTTVTTVPISKRIRIVYPAGFDVSGAAVDGATVLQSGGVVLQSAAGTIVELRTNVGAVNPGAQSIVLTGIINTGTPAAGLAVDIYTYDLPFNPANFYDDDDPTPATFAISGTVKLEAAGTPIATNNLYYKTATGGTIALTNFELTASGENADITELKFTPTYTIIDGTSLTGLEVYRDANTNGILDGGDASISSGAAAVTGSGNEVTVSISNYRLPDGVPREFFVVGTFTTYLAGSSTIDVDISAINTLTTRPTGVTSGIETGPGGITGFTINGPVHQATPLTSVDITTVALEADSQYINALAADTIKFTTVNQVPNGGLFKIRYPSGFNIAGAAIDAATVTQSGIDPTVTGTNGDTVLITTGAIENIGAQTIILSGIVNTGTAASGISLHVYTANAAGTLIDGDDPTPSTFAIAGTVTQEAAATPIIYNSLLFNIIEGRTVALTNFKLTASGEDADITELKFTPTYTAFDSTVLTGLDVFRDTNANGILDAGEASITSGAAAITGSGNELTVSVPNYRLTAGVPQEFFVVGNFTADLETGGTISVEVSSLDSLTTQPVGVTSGIQTKALGSSISGITHNSLYIYDVTDPEDLLFADTVFVSASEGGTVTISPGGFYTKHQVEIPPNAAADDISVVVVVSMRPTMALCGVFSAVEFYVEDQPDYVFDLPVILTLEYLDYEVTDDVEDLVVHYWCENCNCWKMMSGIDYQTLDKDEQTIELQTTTLGIFGIISIPDRTIVSELHKKWNMVAVPVNPRVNDQPDSVYSNIRPFRNEPYNSSIYTFDEERNKWIIPSTMENTSGYIVWSYDDETSVSYVGQPVNMDITRDLSFNGTGDHKGWHLLGNPYTATLDMSTHLTMSNVNSVVYHWDGTEYVFYPDGGLDVDLPVGAGIFVMANAADAYVEFQYPCDPCTSPPSLSKTASGLQSGVIYDWRMQIQAESGNNRDTHNYIGVSEYADEENDIFDAYELVPLNSEFISLYFPKSERNFTQDIQPMKDGIARWDFVVATNSSDNSVTLKWELPDDIEPELDVILTTPSGEEINMRERSEYIYNIQARLKKKTDTVPGLNADPTDFSGLKKTADADIQKFTVIVGKDSKEETPLVPEIFYLNQNYPNPFNPETNIEFGLPESGQVTLKIYNTLGQEIRTLVNRNLPAGVHRFKWDGRNNYGTRVASGVYIYRISANNKIQIKKMMLIR